MYIQVVEGGADPTGDNSYTQNYPEGESIINKKLQKPIEQDPLSQFDTFSKLIDAELLK